MAEYPCDHHGARYDGPSNRVYLNVYREEQKLCLKGSVCGDCLAALVSDWLQWTLHEIQAGGYDWPVGDPELDTLWIDAGASSRPLGRRPGR